MRGADGRGRAPIECSAHGAPRRYLRPAPFTGTAPSMGMNREDNCEAPVPQPS